MVIELANPNAAGPDDPKGMIVVAQGGTITTRKILDEGVAPYREDTPEGDFEEALAAHLTFLAAAGFQVVE